jgi:hypothetical protein
VLILLLWQRLGRASVGDKLHAAFLVDYTYPEPLAEFFETLASGLFLLVFLIAFAHRLKTPSASNFSRTTAKQASAQNREELRKREKYR